MIVPIHKKVLLAAVCTYTIIESSEDFALAQLHSLDSSLVFSLLGFDSVGK